MTVRKKKKKNSNIKTKPVTLNFIIKAVNQAKYRKPKGKDDTTKVHTKNEIKINQKRGMALKWSHQFVA